jgi:hypothetical protein
LVHCERQRVELVVLTRNPDSGGGIAATGFEDNADQITHRARCRYFMHTGTGLTFDDVVPLVYTPHPSRGNTSYRA